MATPSLVDKAKQGQLTETDQDFLWDLDNEDLALRIQNMHLLATHKNSHFSIYIDADNLQKGKQGEFVDAKAILDNGYSNTRVEIDCIVYLSDWSKLENTRQGRINLFDHFKNLYANKGKGIGLCTFQNGIQNTPENFKDMGEKILDKLKVQKPSIKPLCLIGFYNKTCGSLYRLTDDLIRLANEWELNVRSVLTIRQLICTLSNYLPSNILWTHFCHSEASLIANEIVTTKDHRLDAASANFANQQLIIVSYGGVAPVRNYALKTINTYSLKDITMFFATSYLDKFPKPSDLSDEALKVMAAKMYTNCLEKRTYEQIFTELKASVSLSYIDSYPYVSEKDGYTITLVESLGDYGFKIEKDHAFDGATYQAKLRKDIEGLQRKYSFL